VSQEEAVRLAEGSADNEIIVLLGELEVRYCEWDGLGKVRQGLAVRSETFFELEIGDLQAEKESLKKRVEELESEIENKPDSLDSIGIVQWLTETVFFSDLFTEKKYSVRLARSGEYMTFLPDVEGKCRCEGGKIVIPDMGRYLDFKKTDFQAYADGKMIRIVL